MSDTSSYRASLQKSSWNPTGVVCLPKGVNRIMPNELSGPYVMAAFLCEKVLQEVDGVLSFVRVVDRFLRPKPTAMIQPQPIQAMLVIGFKAGGIGAGRYGIKLRIYKPSAPSTMMAEISRDAFFEAGEDRGVNVVVPLVILGDEEGVFWIEVLFEDMVLTRTTLRVMFATMPMPEMKTIQQG